MLRYIHLPDDIVYEIMLKLDPYSLDSIARVDVRHQRLYTDGSFWTHKLRQDYHVTENGSARIYFIHLLNDKRFYC